MNTKKLVIENTSPELLEFVDILKKHHEASEKRLEIRVDNLKNLASTILDTCKDLNEWEFECVINLVKSGSESVNK